MAHEPDPNPTLSPHPLAEIVPRMSDDEFLDLRKSIRRLGLLPGEEIVLHEGRILDGRHRYEACLKEGVPPRFRQYDGDDPEGFVLAKITRRNLDESTRALAAGRLLLALPGQDGGRLRQEDVRRRFGLGETIVGQSVRVLASGSPELVRMIENGQVKMKQAAAVVRLPKQELEAVVAAGPDSVKVKATQIYKGVVRPEDPPPSSPEFPPLTAEILRDMKSLAAKFTRYIRVSEGKRFEQYVRLLQLPGMIDYGRVKIVDKGEGLEKVHAAFVGLRELYRLVVAASRARAYPAAELANLMKTANSTQLDGDRPPPEPEHDPAQLVEPESL